MFLARYCALAEPPASLRQTLLQERKLEGQVPKPMFTMQLIMPKSFLYLLCSSALRAAATETCLGLFRMPPSSTVLGVHQPVPESSASVSGSEERASLAEIELRLKDLLSRKEPVHRTPHLHLNTTALNELHERARAREGGITWR
jgi:hypothetical protein